MNYLKVQNNNIQVTIPIPEDLFDRFLLAQSDCFRICGKKLSAIRMLRRGDFRFYLFFRLSSDKSIIGIISRRIFHVMSIKRNIDISPFMKIGYGLYLGHLQSVVFNQNAIIGNNCNFSQFTTIGSNNDKGAIIGDNVYVGPNVCIVEDVVIGHNVTIGAGSVVCKDVLPDLTVAGIPAKKISNKQHPEYISNRFIVSCD